MTNSRYPLYVIAILLGGGIALWAGLSPFFLIFVVVCLVMIFFMMRSGMDGDMHGGHGDSDSSASGTTTGPADLDGSHERIDRH